MATEVDTNVKLPKAVRDASARSDAIHQQAYNTEAGGDGNQQQPDPNTEPQTQQVQQPTKGQDQGQDQGREQKVTLPTPTQEDWQHRYNSANGRVQHLTQENNRLNNENANLRNRMTSLESRLNELERQRHTAPKVTPEVNNSDPLAGVVSPDEIKEYGPEFFNIITKVAQAAAKPVIDSTVSNLKNDITKEITPLKTQVQDAGSAARTIAEERFYSQIGSALPNWREINRHPKFHNWLSLTDELSGATRKALLDNAVGRMDAARVLSFFTSFLRSEGITVPQGGKPAGNGKVSLEQLAAPGKANTGSGASPKNAPEKQIITRADIRQFYADVQKNKYTPEQIKAAEVELQLAAQEGRIRD